MSARANDTLPRVVLVEHDAGTLAELGRVLGAIPVDARPAQTCAAARRAADVLGSVDLVVTELALLDGDGIDMAAEIRAVHGCRVIVMSGFDPPASPPDGIDRWIVRPVDPDALGRAVLELVGRVTGQAERGTATVGAAGGANPIVEEMSRVGATGLEVARPGGRRA